jgi:hypothetical protein
MDVSIDSDPTEMGVLGPYGDHGLAMALPIRASASGRLTFRPDDHNGRKVAESRMSTSARIAKN